MGSPPFGGSPAVIPPDAFAPITPLSAPAHVFAFTSIPHIFKPISMKRLDFLAKSVNSLFFSKVIFPSIYLGE